MTRRHLSVWSGATVAAGRNTLQTGFDGIIDLACDGQIVGPAAALGAVGAIVHCPVVSIED